MKNLFSFKGSWLWLVVLVLRLSAAQAQAPGWNQLSLPTVTPIGATSIVASVADASGNVYVVGRLIGTTTIAGTQFTFGANQADIYVARWSAQSGYVWAVRAGGTPGSSGTDQGYIEPTSIALVGGSLYIGGTFYGATAAFGSTLLTNGGPAITTRSSFVAKFSTGSSADFVWATRLSAAPMSGGNFRLTAVGASSSGVYAAGWFTGSTLGVGSITLTNAGTTNIFVAKLTDAGGSGSVQWAQQAGGTLTDQCTALAVRANAVYLTGFTNSPVATFGPTSAPANGAFMSNAFVAKLLDAGSNGAFQWVTRAGPATPASPFTTLLPYAIALSGPAVYIAGTYFGNAGFGATTISTPNPNDYDVFAAKLTDAGPSGTFNWGVAGGSNNMDFVGGLAANGGSLYLAGRFTGPTATFGTTTLTDPNTSTSSLAMYLTKISDGGVSGAFAWAQAAGATTTSGASQRNTPTGVVLAAGRGHLVGNLAGSYSGNPSAPSSTTATFGSLTQTTPGGGIGFIATWLDNGLLATAPGLAARPALALWPNPARDHATLRLPAPAEPVPVLLLDALGRLVRRYPAPTQLDFPLDLRGLPAGLYVLQVGAARQRLTVE